MASIVMNVMNSPIRYNARLRTHEEFSMIGAMQTAEPELESPFAVSLRKGSLSKTDQEILALIQNVPQKTSSIYKETFQLYQTALRVYQAVSINKLPCEVGIHIPDRDVKRKVYQLVFNTLYRKL